MDNLDAINLFQHVEDAWEGGLAEELGRLSRAALDGETVWFATGSFLQATWLRARALRAGQSLFGLEFMDLRTLRRRLCEVYHLPSPSFGRETLRLILQNALGEDPVHASMAEHLLVALDEFALSGFDCEDRLEEVLEVLRVPRQAWPTVTQLFHSDFWRPRVDQRLRELAQPGQAGGQWCAFGLSGGDLRESDLLTAGARSVRRFSWWFPLPVMGRRSDFLALEQLEAATGIGHQICPAAPVDQPFSWVLEAWQGFGGSGGRAPAVVCAERPAAEASAVVQLVADALVAGHANVLVVVPEQDAFGAVVVDALSEAGIAVADDLRRNSHGSRSRELQKTLAALHGRERSLTQVWRLLELIVEDPVELVRLRRRLTRQFDKRQTPVLEALLPGLVPPAWEPYFLRMFVPWPERAAFEDLAASWSRVLDDANALSGLPGVRAVKLDTGDLEPLWQELAAFLQGHLISGPLFAEFLLELLDEPSRLQAGVGRTARVCVSSACRALATSWDVVIISRCSGPGWPRLTTENPLLGDLAQAEMQRRYQFTWRGAPEKRRLELESYLHLLTHTQKHLSFLYSAADELGDPVVPNEVITFLEYAVHVDPIFFRTDPAPPAPPPSPPKTLERFAHVWTQRTDAQSPYNEYSFVFAGLSYGPWSPSVLERVLGQPATFAYQHVFGCEREHDREFRRQFGRALGQLCHGWMGRVLGEADQPLAAGLAFGAGAEPLSAAELRCRMTARLEQEVSRFDGSISSPQRCVWWESVLQQAEWTCRQFIHHVASYLEKSPWLAAEYPVEVCLPAPDPLALKGRFDLLLLTAPDLPEADVLVIDFKTSRRTTLLKDGSSLQFHGYRWMCEALGVRSARILVARPGGCTELDFARCTESGAASRGTLARIQNELCFGYGTGAGGDCGNEHLPIATVPLNGEVLRHKHRLTFA
ncbi:MAG TPA: PD-(D/E)XK nuclease family protein [Chthoniobacterales bacterium]